ELIDRLADRLGQITEIEIGRDLVAYIRFGEPELRLGLLEDGLRAGALGMSSGLFTPPGSFARPDEMMALCTGLKRHNAAYFTHTRDESNKIMDGVEEAIDVARTCGVHVEIVPEVLWSRQLGQGGADSGQDRRGASQRVRHRLRCLSLHSRRQPAEEPVAALGANWRQRDDAEAARAAGDPCANRCRDCLSWAQQLGPDPVMGSGADLDLAAAAGDGWSDRGGVSGGAGLRSDRPNLRSSDRRWRGNPRSDCVDLRGRHSHDRSIAN